MSVLLRLIGPDTGTLTDGTTQTMGRLQVELKKYCATVRAMIQKTNQWPLLMSRAQDGDKDAYAQLLKGITPWLRSLAYKAGIERADMEDAVHDILLTMHSVRHTYDQNRPFAPWLAAIARHRLIDRLRKSGRTLAREIPFEEEHETISMDESNGLEERESARQLQAAMTHLSDGQRQAVELLKLKEMSLKEASLHSGQSEQALKVSVHRAIKRLRTLLTEGKM